VGRTADVVLLVALVSEGVAGATCAFLEADRAAARNVVERDLLIDQTYRELEECVLLQLTRSRANETDRRPFLRTPGRSRRERRPARPRDGRADGDPLT
jgi:phosphate uptake regulator